MGLVEYAKQELGRIPIDEDGIQEEMNEGILEVVRVFAEQGHSGFSASYALGVLKNLLAFKPLSPLTGENSEWTEIREGVYQNKRCYSVFKGVDGKAYDIDAVVYSDDGGETFYSKGGHRHYISFPYTPPKESEKIVLEKEIEQ